MVEPHEAPYKFMAKNVYSKISTSFLYDNWNQLDSNEIMKTFISMVLIHNLKNSWNIENYFGFNST
jgi:hypothetical protein